MPDYRVWYMIELEAVPDEATARRVADDALQDGEEPTVAYVEQADADGEFIRLGVG